MTTNEATRRRALNERTLTEAIAKLRGYVLHERDGQIMPGGTIVKEGDTIRSPDPLACESVAGFLRALRDLGVGAPSDAEWDSALDEYWDARVRAYRIHVAPPEERDVDGWVRKLVGALVRVVDLRARERAAYAAKCADAEARAERLEAAIRWALGEVDDFAARPEDAGAYWWRRELRGRAGLVDTSNGGEG